MKSKLPFVLTLLLFSTTLSRGQGTFVFDQQSSTDETPFPAAGAIIQQFTPVGQSFTPALSEVDFIRLKLYDNNPSNGLGATLYINLRTNSITGPILGTTTAVVLTNGFADVANFFFPTNLVVTPGAIYFFEPVVQTGDLWKIESGSLNYPGGTGFSQGQPFPGDLWFREGVIVPEPSSVWLLLLGGGFFLFRRCKRRV